MKKEVSMTASQPLEMGQLEEILQAYRGQKGAVIPVLQKAQKIYGYLPEEVLQRIARGLRVPISRIYGVATFYSQFYLTRRGRHVVRQCDGTACHVRGSGQIIEKIEKELGVKAGGTTPDYKVTYEVVYCLGSCGLAPVATVDGAAVGKLAPERMAAMVQQLD
jgi:NADH-quinone oxidoreductase subunit E